MTEPAGYKYERGKCPDCDKGYPHTFYNGYLCRLCGLGSPEFPLFAEMKPKEE